MSAVMFSRLRGLSSNAFKRAFRNLSGAQLISCGALLLVSIPAYSATSESQASRIMDIAGTIFDSYPKPQASGNGYDLGVSLEVTGLPELDPTVGTTQLKLPNPAFLLTPSLHGQYGLSTRSGHLIALGSWVGSLPPGSEAVLGIKPAVFHYFGGVEASGAFAVSAATKAVFSLFGQYSGAEVQGKIASAEKNDKFTSNTVLMGFGVGAQHAPKKDFVGFAELRFFKKNTSSGLDIGDDSTKIRLTDDLSRDAVFGFPLLFSAGLQYLDYSVTLSETFVPSRALLPSLKLSWRFVVDQQRKNEPVLRDATQAASLDDTAPKLDTEATTQKKHDRVSETLKTFDPSAVEAQPVQVEPKPETTIEKQASPNKETKQKENQKLRSKPPEKRPEKTNKVAPKKGSAK